MKTRYFFAALAMVAATAMNANAAGIVTFNHNLAQGYVDILYTPQGAAEFTNWDLNAKPTIGSILDPTTSARHFNQTSGAASIDTFANTVFSAVGASGAPNYVFTEYNPGSAFPPVPADPAPTRDAQLPAPDELNWSIFDTNTGDGAIQGFTPYLMGRVVYSAGGAGNITVKFFDTTNAGIGESFSTAYGIPEPATFGMASMALLGLAAFRRRK
jgi:hypothetical protein